MFELEIDKKIDLDLLKRISAYQRNKLDGFSLTIEEEENVFRLKAQPLENGQFSKEDADKFLKLLNQQKISYVKLEKIEDAISLKLLNLVHSEQIIKVLSIFQKQKLTDIEIYNSGSNAKFIELKVKAKENGENSDEHLQKYIDLLESAGITVYSEYRPDMKKDSDYNRIERAFVKLSLESKKPFIFLKTEKEINNFELLLKIISEINAPDNFKKQLSDFLVKSKEDSLKYLSTVEDMLVDESPEKDLTQFLKNFPEFMEALLSKELVQLLQSFPNYYSLVKMIQNNINNGATSGILSSIIGYNKLIALPSILKNINKSKTFINQVFQMSSQDKQLKQLVLKRNEKIKMITQNNIQRQNNITTKTNNLIKNKIENKEQARIK